MANEEHLKILKQGVNVWNQWREDHPKVKPDLRKVVFYNVTKHRNSSGYSRLRVERVGDNLRGANLSSAKLSEVNFRRVDLSNANLSNADLSNSILSEAKLEGANLVNAKFKSANLRGIDMRKALLYGANFQKADLSSANLRQVSFSNCNINFTKASFCNADLSEADFTGEYLIDVNLSNAQLSFARLNGATLDKSVLTGAILNNAQLYQAKLRLVNLEKADLSLANLLYADLSGACLREADLRAADLSGANLNGADVRGANLQFARLIRTNLENANISNSLVFGTSTWNVTMSNSEQSNLVITFEDEPIIRVDRLEVAQFIYLLLNNQNLRNIINTVAKKAVLILGRFTPKRKMVLEAIRQELRRQEYIPILFDFDIPETRDVTETVTLLARMSRFIIADLTEPSSIPKELEAIVPTVAVPVRPLIEDDGKPYSMFTDNWKYDWVLKVYPYSELAVLLSTFRDQVIGPAETKAAELDKKRLEART